MKNMRKIASVLLALVMVFALASTVFAAGESEKTVTLTINTTAGHTYKVYQLLTGEVSNLDNGSGTLSNTKVGDDAATGSTVESIDAALKGADGNYLSGAALGDKAYSLINTSSTNAKTVVGDDKEKSVDVAPGYYVVVDTWTNGEEVENDVLSRYLVTVVGPTTMTPKVSKPEIDKDIVDTDANTPLANSDNKVNTAAIGDTIDFEITGTVPNTEGYTYYYYVVNDTMSEGLTLNQNSFVVTVGSDTLTKGTDYYVYVDETTNSFQLALANLKTLVDTADNGVSVGANISIKYSATINDKAAIGLDPNTNTAKLQYSNNPGNSSKKDVDTDHPGVPDPGNATGVGPEKVTKTYVTELTILKVDNEGNALKDAQFTLTGTNLTKVIVNTDVSFAEVDAGEGDYYKLTDGTFTKTAPSSAAEGEEGYNANLYASTTPDYVLVTTVSTSSEATGDKIDATTTEDGYIVFTGLNAGDYTLTETVTPEGYNTIAPITFAISATVGTDGFEWTSDNSAIVLDKANGVFDATIVNVPGTNLPTTGGMGTTLFYILGGVLVAAAVVLLVTKKRMSTAE